MGSRRFGVNRKAQTAEGLIGNGRGAGTGNAWTRLVAIAAGIVVLSACATKPPARPPQAAPHPVVHPKITSLDDARALRGGPQGEYEHALTVLASSQDATTRRRALAMLGLYLLEAKRYEPAIERLSEAAAIYPEVAPFLRLRILEAETALGRAAEAAALAAELGAGNTTAAAIAKLRLPALRAALGDSAATDAAWNAAMAIPIDELTEPELVTMANALAKAGREDLARKTRMRLLTDYTQGRFTEQTYGLVKRDVAALSAEQKAALAAKLARADRYDQALDLYAQLPEGSSLGRSARLRALFSSRRYAQLLNETAGATLDDPALALLRARAAWRDDRPQEFLADLARLEERFPSSREAGEAKVLRAKYYSTDDVRYDQAISNLRDAIAAGATGNDGENLWTLGFTYLLAGKDDDALATFDRVISGWPDGDWKTNSLFWSAKLWDRRGETGRRDAAVAALLAQFPFSYYSYRAKELWGEPAATAGEDAGAERRFPDVDAELAQLDEPRVAVVRELLEIDLLRPAAQEMKSLAAAYPSSAGIQFLLADVYLRSGEPFRANGVLQRSFREFVRHGGEGIPQRFWEILFPLEYWDAIRTEAAKYGHDPYLLASIIRQESGFEPSTVSNAGAVGLMQIMPEEASRIAGRAGLGPVTRAALFDPETNVAVGAAEYAQKLEVMNGNPILAIAAYNAGEAAVGTWIEKTPVEDIDLFVESIPYAETRLYVKTVTRNRFEYRRIHEHTNTVPDSPEAAR